MAPISLPAGGAAIDKNLIQIRRYSNFSPLIACENCFLQVSPLDEAPLLRKLDKGTPLRFLRTWTSPEGQMWLQVQISTCEILDQPELGRRGWINI